MFETEQSEMFYYHCRAFVLGSLHVNVIFAVVFLPVSGC